MFDHPVYPGAGVVNRIPFQKVLASDCGPRVPGNWGWLDFNGDTPPNGASALAPWLVSGYLGLVSLGSGSVPADCNQAATGSQNCQSQPGADSSTKSSLDQVLCPASTPIAKCPAFPIVVYDAAIDRGNFAQYHPVAFLGVVLRGYQLTGTPRDDYIDFEFVDLHWTGPVGAPTGPPPTVQGVQLCGVDHDPVDRCDV